MKHGSVDVNKFVGVQQDATKTNQRIAPFLRLAKEFHEVSGFLRAWRTGKN